MVKTVNVVRKRLLVSGVVQGVGFRPFVYNLASQLGLTGFVRNDGDGVVIEVEGPPADLRCFMARLTLEAPPAAKVTEVVEEELPPRATTYFFIAESRAGEPRTLISADLATCDDCLAELFNPGDRRYRYPFINCTNCGPRFTISLGVPYDRPRTTMAGFTMCPACQREYDNSRDRRFHAQPNACPVCGPRVSLWDAEGNAFEPGDVIATALDLLKSGKIIAVKGLGGYHLACNARSAETVAELRRRKTREEKPFAVMARDADVIRRYCELSDAELALLASPKRPIVLLKKRPGCDLPEAIAPRNRFLGVMLPYTPLHHLLLAGDLDLLVMTSGNRADEPIAFRDEEVFGHLQGIADYFLAHDRPIARRVDDSVTRVFAGGEYLIRRARGYVPLPVALPRAFKFSVLAVGAELKNTFCLTKSDRAFVSHHIGDMENLETLAAFEEGIKHFKELFGAEPTAVARDLHPDYLASRWARASGLPEVIVQHHHAHIASVLADNRYEAGRVIGFAFDGMGLGDDGALWGGEVLIADGISYERAAHLRYVPQPGGDRAAREPWRMALSWLAAANGGDFPEEFMSFFPNRSVKLVESVYAAMRAGVNSPPTSSVGRLFDAVAALCGVREVISYEGQAAAELEQLADPREGGRYEFAFVGESPMVVDAVPVIEAVAADIRRGKRAAAVAARFHNGLAVAMVELARRLRDVYDVGVVALGGGVFQNVTLLGKVYRLLEDDGFKVLTPRQVPANDGGLSLGQAWVALNRLAKG